MKYKVTTPQGVKIFDLHNIRVQPDGKLYAERQIASSVQIVAHAGTWEKLEEEKQHHEH